MEVVSADSRRIRILIRDAVMRGDDKNVRVTCHVEVDRRRTINQYARGERIGKGQHGRQVVSTFRSYFDHINNTDHSRQALKVVKRNGPRDRIKMLRRNHQQNSCEGGTSALGSMEHSIRREIAVMRRCHHANIVRLYEVMDDPRQDKIYLAMEYLSGGPVQWKDDEEMPILLVAETRRVIRDVILGLEHRRRIAFGFDRCVERLPVHYLGIIHRDIKPGNLLWTKDRTIVKLIDFGVSQIYTSIRHARQEPVEDHYDDALFSDESDLMRRIGTPSFLAPEVLWSPDNSVQQSRGNYVAKSRPVFMNSRNSQRPRPPITEAIDIWSLAVTFYCLLFGHTPFTVPKSANDNVYHNEFGLYNQICTQDWEVDETMGFDRIITGARHSKDLKSEGATIVTLLDQMLQKDPTDRITLSKIKQHPWILGGVLDPKEWITNTSPPTSKDASGLYSQWKRAKLEL
ncbi:hypothetical protein DXG01_005899 [Tephrocybe rancida]|nr:hypothetical protein DXG01_005899 [Tephrocybe rancida]